ncbi:PAS domain-containing protein [Gilvimarinus sp. F26214L]|uniref:PAS domain-containing protein n=1 Tax=Gilvimarinus sp. DZF01 TaxID=3461371 RepID=UPI004045BC59
MSPGKPTVEPDREAGFLDSIMAHLHVHVCVWDAAHRIVYANAALEELLGKSRDQYLGKTLMDLAPTMPVAAILSRQIEAVLETGQSITGEIDYGGPGRGMAHYSYSFSPMLDGSGGPAYVVGVSRDISQRKALEQALEKANEQLEEKVRERTRHLRESEQRYRKLFEAIDEGFCIVQVLFDAQQRSVNYRYLETNPAFARHTGLEHATGATALDVAPDMDRAWFKIFGRVAETGKAERLVEYSRQLDRWFEIDAFRVGDPADRKVATLFRDITERKCAEDELLRVLGLLEGITRGSEDLIAALDNDFRFLYFNDAYHQEFLKLWRCDIEEGTSILEAMAPWPEEQRKARHLWGRALAGESFRTQIDFGPSPAEKRVYDLRFNPIRNPQGRSVGAAHIFRDITDQVRVQSELRESEERLRESDRRKDEYLAMLGHELRNPLAAVRNATELIKRAPVADPGLRRASEVLERQTTHMARLIDGLLEASRIARGKIDLNTQVLDLRTVVEGVLQDRNAHVEARHLVLKQVQPGQPLWVSGDPVRLAQVFDNLMGNAIKFSEPRGQITVRLESQGEWALVRVRDTGVGIRPQMLGRIFEAFYQEEQDIARATGGLGLGLALVKGLVELHQGRIEVTSEGPGRGAEFVVRLPISTAPPSSYPPEVEEPLAPQRILIVEDNQDAGQTLCDLLTLQGHHVRLAENAAQALSRLWESEADLVLCDLGLPGMSGFELARAIRRDPALSQARLVALTGYGQPEDRRRTAAAGFDDHLTKPVDLKSLERTLRKLVVEPEDG